MRHDYYSYTKEQLLKQPKIHLLCYETDQDVFRHMAQEMVEAICKNEAQGKNTVFICPVGPVGQYPYFVELVNAEGISLKNVWFLNMDEYLTDEKEWIPEEDSLSFRGFMNRTVYSKICPDLLMPEDQRVFPDPHRPEAMEELIAELGGVDICFGGIGINGHLAFNEADDNLSAEAFCNLRTRVLEISRETRTANAIGDLNGAVDDMPRFAVTIGMREIFHARKVRLGCFRDWHRSVVRHAAYGEVSAHFPVTLMQNHPDVLLRITEAVAKLPDEI